MFQEQLLKFKNIKLYLVHFIPKDKSVKEFYKTGVTSKYDALERFRNQEYFPWNIEVMKTAYGPTLEVLKAENDLKLKYPKNLYIKQKIKGVTEIFMPESYQTISDIIHFITEKGNEWYILRQGQEEPKYYIKKLASA